MTKPKRSYTENAEVGLKKRHCLTDRIQLGQTSSSTAEKTNYLKHIDSSSISYIKILRWNTGLFISQ